MAKKFESKENAKHKEKKAKKRKTKLDPLDMIETKETRIRRKLTDEKPQAHVEKSTLEDIETQVKEKMKIAHLQSCHQEERVGKEIIGTTFYITFSLPICLG